MIIRDPQKDKNTSSGATVQLDSLATSSNFNSIVPRAYVKPADNELVINKVAYQLSEPHNVVIHGICTATSATPNKFKEKDKEAEALAHENIAYFLTEYTSEEFTGFINLKLERTKASAMLTALAVITGMPKVTTLAFNVQLATYLLPLKLAAAQQEGVEVTNLAHLLRLAMPISSFNFEFLSMKFKPSENNSFSPTGFPSVVIKPAGFTVPIKTLKGFLSLDELYQTLGTSLKCQPQLRDIVPIKEDILLEWQNGLVATKNWVNKQADSHMDLHQCVIDSPEGYVELFDTTVPF
jgi:hypothetical protein